MTRTLFSLSHRQAAQFHGLGELGANHFVRPPNDLANLRSQAWSAEHKDVWDGMSIEQSYLGAASRNIMDKAANRGVLIQRDHTPFVYNAACFRPAVFNISHLCALGIGHQSQGRRNSAPKQSLKLNASLPSCVSEAMCPIPDPGGLAEGERS